MCLCFIKGDFFHTSFFPTWKVWREEWGQGCLYLFLGFNLHRPGQLMVAPSPDARGLQDPTPCQLLFSPDCLIQLTTINCNVIFNKVVAKWRGVSLSRHAGRIPVSDCCGLLLGENGAHSAEAGSTQGSWTIPLLSLDSVIAVNLIPISGLLCIVKI